VWLATPPTVRTTFPIPPPTAVLALDLSPPAFPLHPPHPRQWSQGTRHRSFKEPAGPCTTSYRWVGCLPAEVSSSGPLLGDRKDRGVEAVSSGRTTPLASPPSCLPSLQPPP